MATFLAKEKRIRVLLDGGGEKIIDGVKHRFPARWADFTRTGRVVIYKKEDIEFLKNHDGFGKDFFLAAEPIKGKPAVVKKEK